MWLPGNKVGECGNSFPPDVLFMATCAVHEELLANIAEETADKNLDFHEAVAMNSNSYNYISMYLLYLLGQKLCYDIQLTIQLSKYARQ